MTIQLSTATIVYIASCITILGGAIGTLIKAKAALLKPLVEINNKIEEYEKYLANDKAHLDTIDDVLTELTEANTLLIESVRVLLTHAESGNNSGEIREERKKLDDWLLQGKQYKGDKYERPRSH